MEKDRLARAENRNGQVEKELDEIKTDYRDTQKIEQRLTKENTEMKDQLRIANENLSKQLEVGTARDRENAAINNEVRTLREMLESFKVDSKEQKESHASIASNLRLQLDETREIVSRVKETKEREFRKLREKCDEEIRNETDKY